MPAVVQPPADWQARRTRTLTSTSDEPPCGKLEVHLGVLAVCSKAAASPISEFAAADADDCKRCHRLEFCCRCNLC